MASSEYEKLRNRNVATPGYPEWYTTHQRRKARRLIVAFVVAVAACTWAGYEIGLTKGRGWRGALIDNGCSVVCRRIGT